MQTFLPVTSMVRSMEFLDVKRLGKQRVEACQILEILLNTPVLPKNLQSVVPFDRKFSHWDLHPAVQMWKGHEEWLKQYLACAVGEWCSRGYLNSIKLLEYDVEKQDPPPWLGYEEFHKSHRCNLLRKLPSHYSQYWSNEGLDLSTPYYWPTLRDFKENVDEVIS